MTDQAPQTATGGVVITLPWPPSINHYWRHAVINRSVRVLISEEGRRFREAAIAAVLQRFGTLSPVKERLHVTITAHPPNLIRRDLSNIPKAVEDALTHARVWEDDSQIDHLEIIRGPVRKPAGMVLVRIEKIPQQERGLFDG